MAKKKQRTERPQLHAEFLVALDRPKRAENGRLIRTVLRETSNDAWSIPYIGVTLEACSEARLGALVKVAGSMLSRTRVGAVLGPRLSPDWARFFDAQRAGKPPAADRAARPSTTQPGRTPGSSSTPRPSTNRSTPTPQRAGSGNAPTGKAVTGKAVPLRDAAPLFAKQLAEAAATRGSTQVKKETSKPPRTTMQCRECLREKPMKDFPNPRRRKCADCGGTPAGTSVRTWSGGAPTLGKGR